MNLEESLESCVVRMMEVAAFNVSPDVTKALRKALDREESDVAKINLSAIVENIEAAKQERKPVCQDTGTPTFFLKIGEDFPVKAKIHEILRRAVRRATKEIPLRPNAVNPWTLENSGDNTGRMVPIVHVEIVEGNSLELTYLAKGGGSENTVQLFMLSPVLGVNGIKKAVLEAIYRAGPKPCPPVVVGVGVGGSSELCLKIAKRAALRPIDQPNPDEKLRNLERELLDMINSSGFGPMGLGGRTYALAVHVDWAHKHPASLPVGISTICWALRKSVAKVHSDGSFEILAPEVV